MGIPKDVADGIISLLKKGETAKAAQALAAAVEQGLVEQDAAERIAAALRAGEAAQVRKRRARKPAK